TRPRVLVAEKIGDSGIALLREHFDVELGVDWSRQQLAERIGQYDGVLIRSATKLDSDLLSKATSLRAVGRAGVGVDNVDVAVAFGPCVSAERYRELGVERAGSSDEVYASADFITLHLPNTPDTQGWLNAEALAKCKDGVRVLNVARGPLIVEEDLQAALDSGKVAGAALDVFRSEPVVEHPLFSYPNVVLTPHLGASTAEATDRAGYQ